MENNVHYKSLQEHEFLKSCDVEPTKEDRKSGVKITATIDRIKQEEVIDLTKTASKKNTSRKPIYQTCMTCYFKEANLKPMILNKTNQTAISKVCGSNYVNDWTGTKITIYVKHDMNVGGKLTDGLRILDYAPVDKLMCEECGDIIKPFGKLNTAEAVAEYTYNKYGNQLCGKCATARKETMEENK